MREARDGGEPRRGKEGSPAGGEQGNRTLRASATVAWSSSSSSSSKSKWMSTQPRLASVVRISALSPSFTRSISANSTEWPRFFWGRVVR